MEGGFVIVVIDNYDSFTYNLVQILCKNSWTVEVYKNDEISISDLQRMSSDIHGFLLSPGPGHPEQSGISPEVVKHFHQSHPIFGVCLGHQILAQFFGAQIMSAERIMHGKISLIHHEGIHSYFQLPMPFPATRYHSLLVDWKSMPEELLPTSWTVNSQNETWELMGFRHKKWNLEGVQFHPESILCPDGEKLVQQFFMSHIEKSPL